MNELFVTLMVSSLLGAAPAQSPGGDDYGAALNAARKTGRPLLVVLEKPNEAAARIDQVHFSKEEPRAEASTVAKNDLLQPYVFCRIDVTTPYGARVAEAFRVSEFPHTVITNKGASKMIYRKTGTFSASEWKSTLVSYKNVRTVRRASRSRSNFQQYRPSRAFCST